VQFPPAATVWAVFAGWARGGAWQRILDALRDRLRVWAGRDRCLTAAIIDSPTVPAADTVPRSSRGWDGGTRTNGVKRHLAVDVNGLLLTVVVSAASIQDRDAAHRRLAALRGSFCTIGLVWADGGYLGRLLIWAKDVLTRTVQIIKRIPGATGFHVRPRIWVVERSFAWINKQRRCARDYDTRADHHQAMAHRAMITTMTRRLART
jgi:transposase